MKKKMNLTVILALTLAVYATSANALTITVGPGAAQDASSVFDIVTSRVNSVFPAYPNMLGMQVSATFVGGGSETLSWALPPTGSVYDYSGSLWAGVTGSGFSLYTSGNTGGSAWYFTGGSSAITSLSFAGIPSNIAFDQTTSPGLGTAGSSGGFTFQADTNGDGFVDNPDWTVIYSNPITLNGAAAVGDLYGTLKINFDTAYLGDFNFNQDTDSFVPITGGGTPPGPGPGTASVPEPGTMMLLGSGLVGLVGFGRRRMKK